MQPSDEQVRGYVRRLLLSRMRLLCDHGFYGLLLMHMKFSLDESCGTAYTDGTRITFDPKFLEGLSDQELDFVMMHEVMHVVLQHCFRGKDFDRERYNIAADIVVNSNIMLENGMDPASIAIREFGGEAMHVAPDDKEGHNYTAEQVYDMLKSSSAKGRPKQRSLLSELFGNENRDGRDRDSSGQDPSRRWDDHSHWSDAEDNDELRDVWVKHFEDACEAVQIREAALGRGLMPAFAKRMLNELQRAQTDWRTILNDFVQEDVNDYSFAPPDRRFDGPFFLPDFNEKDDVIEDILFMVDTSGSMSDDMVTAAYSEVKGAIDQFDGKLRGWLGFFDAAIIEPKPFEDEETLRVIKPAGGGGTDFSVVFKYVAKHMQDRLPASIIMLTDGFAPFPREQAAMGIPVLWLLVNDEVNPPWGKVARITV